MTTRTVLVVTDRFDPTADFVVTELNRRGTPVFRFDTAEFPMSLAVSAELSFGDWEGRLWNTRRSVDLAAVCGVYYRRPTAFRFPEEMTEQERIWSGVQARLGFGGLLACSRSWLNHPHRIGYAEYKPVQLQAARSAGLRVPRTLVTNVPQNARRFVAEVGAAVCKPFGGTAAFRDTDGAHQLFATPVDAERAGEASVAHTMHLFQQWVPKAYEVRVTVVDGRCFAARIDAHSEASRIDWRADYRSLSYSPIETPAGVRSGITALLLQLGLRFAASDFVVTPNGEWYFLEANPNGQWAWIETATGLPITAAIADALEGRMP